MSRVGEVGGWKICEQTAELESGEIFLYVIHSPWINSGHKLRQICLHT